MERSNEIRGWKICSRCSNIMGRMDDLYIVTNELLNLLKKENSNAEERTNVITKVNELLERRGKIIQKIKPPYSDEEEQIGIKIIELDKEIRAKMDSIYNAIQHDLKQLKQKRDSNITYMNPYKN